jgi:hypothetical protein
LEPLRLESKNETAMVSGTSVRQAIKQSKGPDDKIELTMLGLKYL